MDRSKREREGRAQAARVADGLRPRAAGEGGPDGRRGRLRAARPAHAGRRAARTGCGALARPACALLLAWAIAGCGGKPAMPPSAEPQPPAELRTGDVTVRATTLPTLRLNEAMAREYGVERDPRSVLLVIGLRRGSPAQETSVAGRVSARASDLLGKQQPIALREVAGEGYLDYVGVARVSMPDTLRFEIDARPEGAPATVLRFHRDFFPEATSP